MKKLISAAKYFGISLNAIQLKQYDLYRSELISWNKSFNLTSIVSPEEVELKHFADSLSVLPTLGHILSEGAPEVIDIGTGAGFPGIPLKIAFPQIKITLVDSTQKKMRFVKHVAEKLGLENVTALAGRAEELAHNSNHRGHYPIVLSRAVAKLPTLAELCVPFCSIDGVFIAYKKGDISAEVDSASKALSILGASLKEISPVAFPELDDSRFLIVIEKNIDTAPKYPRRPGIPTKNPL